MRLSILFVRVDDMAKKKTEDAAPQEAAAGTPAAAEGAPPKEKKPKAPVVKEPERLSSLAMAAVRKRE